MNAHNEPQPPADLESERAMLSCVLVDPLAVALTLDVEPADLYDVRHRDYLAAAHALFGADAPVDAVSIAQHMREAGRDVLETVPHIMSLMDSPGRSASVPHYAESITRWARLRRAATAAHKASSAMHGGDPLGAETGFAAVSHYVAGEERRNPVMSFEASGAVVLERLYSEEEARAVGLRTGFGAIDDGPLGLLGFHRTHLTVLAARPSMGKTALALNLAWNVARREGPVLFSCGEMAHHELTERLLAYIAQVPYPGIRAGRLPYEGRDRVRDAYNELCNTPLYLWDKAAVTTNDILAKSRWVAAKTGTPCAMVVVDYLQRMGCDVRHRDKRLTVEHNAEALKTMASNEGLHMLLLSQLNRSCESREDKRPILSDLRESGAIEQEANEVLMLYRDHVYHPESADENGAELIVRKARGAQTGMIDLRWQGRLMTFRG